METFYPVTCNSISCGKVSVRKQGLYYCFHCRCAVETKEIYRLILSRMDQQHSLGVLVPSDNCFELTAKIPVKHIPEGEWLFCIVSGSSPSHERFIPICPEEPFSYISRLQESFLVYRNGQPGISVKETQE